MSRLSEARAKVNSEYDRQRLMLKLMAERLARMRGEEQRAEEERNLMDLLDRRYG